MQKITVPIKVKQIAESYFVDIPLDSPLIPLIAIAGNKKKSVDISKIKCAINWMKKHGSDLQVKQDLDPDRAMKRLKNALKLAIEQSTEVQVNLPKNKCTKN